MEELEFTRNTYTSVFRSKTALARPRTRAIIAPSAHSRSLFLSLALSHSLSLSLLSCLVSQIPFAFSYRRVGHTLARDPARPALAPPCRQRRLCPLRLVPLHARFPVALLLLLVRIHASKQTSKQAPSHACTQSPMRGQKTRRCYGRRILVTFRCAFPFSLSPSPSRSSSLPRSPRSPRSS